MPVVARSAADYTTPPASGLRVTWLGHSTMLLEIDGRRVLIDPVWGERASPFTFAGPQRFFAPPLPLAELPPIDAVRASRTTTTTTSTCRPCRALAARGVRLFVPLGVGAHLGRGASPRRESPSSTGGRRRASARSRSPPRPRATSPVAGSATPTARSGRVGRSPGASTACTTAATQRCTTSSREIGERLGPFDLTMIEVGAYDALWADVHLGPGAGRARAPTRARRRDAARALGTVRSRAARLDRADRARGRRGGARRRARGNAAPRRHAGADASRCPTARWWPALPWRTAAEAPIRSTGIVDSPRSA